MNRINFGLVPMAHSWQLFNVAYNIQKLGMGLGTRLGWQARASIILPFLYEALIRIETEFSSSLPTVMFQSRWHLNMALQIDTLH